MNNNQIKFIGATIIIGCGVISLSIVVLASATNLSVAKGSIITPIITIIVGACYASLALNKMKNDEK